MTSRTIPLLLLLAASAAAQPGVALHAGVYPGLVWKGLPAIFTATLMPQPGRDTVTVAEGDLQVRLTDDKGNEVAWPLEAMDRFRFPLELPPFYSASEVRVLSAAQTADLPDGDYLLTVTLGEVRSETLRFRVQPQPDTWEIDQDLARLRLESRYQLYLGNHDAAIEVLQKGIERIPDDPWLIADLASAQDAAGRTADALDTIHRAIATFRQRFPKATHPPSDLYRMRNELTFKLIESEEVQ